jgi:hypothetical protein
MELTFGRYTDSFKSKEKLNFWNESIKLFESGKFLDAYNLFFMYLCDDKISNVTVTKGGNFIDVSLIQGSKLVKAHITQEKVTAEAELAMFDKVSIPVMRRLLEMNYSLYYSRFAIKENGIYLRFDSRTEDCPPGKMYFALKETATKADKMDDLLLDEFSVLHPIDESITEQLPEEQKEIKYKYFIKWISGTLNRIKELNENKFEGAISYMLLNLIYKIDFLIVPEGKILNELEILNGIYWGSEGRPLVEINTEIKSGFEKLLAKPKENVTKEFYKVKATFGVNAPAYHQSVVNTINDNLKNPKNYTENGYEDIAKVIFEYIVNHCLYTYGLSQPTLKLFRMYSMIYNAEYFSELGFKENYYNPDTKMLNGELIKKTITEIIEEGRHQFPQLSFDLSKINFASINEFTNSFLTEILNLNFEN